MCLERGSKNQKSVDLGINCEHRQQTYKCECGKIVCTKHQENEKKINHKMYPDHIKTILWDCKDMSADAYFNIMAQKHISFNDKLLFMKQEITIE